MGCRKAWGVFLAHPINRLVTFCVKTQNAERRGGIAHRRLDHGDKRECQTLSRSQFSFTGTCDFTSPHGELGRAKTLVHLPICDWQHFNQSRIRIPWESSRQPSSERRRKFPGMATVNAVYGFTLKFGHPIQPTLLQFPNTPARFHHALLRDVRRTANRRRS